MSRPLALCRSVAGLPSRVFSKAIGALGAEQTFEAGTFDIYASSDCALKGANSGSLYKAGHGVPWPSLKPSMR